MHSPKVAEATDGGLNLTFSDDEDDNSYRGSPVAASLPAKTSSPKSVDSNNRMAAAAAKPVVSTVQVKSPPVVVQPKGKPGPRYAVDDSADDDDGMFDDEDDELPLESPAVRIGSGDHKAITAQIAAATTKPKPAASSNNAQRYSYDDSDESDTDIRRPAKNRGSAPSSPVK